MTQKCIVSLSVVAALGLLSPLTAHAFGLGQISVNSALNQPFEAEIPVTSLRATERGNLDVRMASPSDFERAGLDRNLLLTQLRFEVIEQGASALVKITSQVPIKEPFLDFLVTASAGEGRMLREYTVLLDPPAAVFNRPSQPTTTPLRSNPRASDAPVSRPSTPVDRYQVRSGDTLWQIAQQTRPASDITAQQMMMALLASNPDAFQRNNINGLKADASLRIPDAATIRQLSPVQANAAVNEQLLQWQNRNRPTVESVESASESADTSAQTISQDNESDASAEAEAVTENNSEQLSEDASRLQLVAAADDGDAEADPSELGDPDVQALNEQLTLAQETIEAQNQENIDFKARMDAMEEQLETMRRLLSLKDEDMARLQAMLENDSAAADTQPATTLDIDSESASAQQGNNANEADAPLTEAITDEAAIVQTDKPAAANYLDTGKAFVSNYLKELLLGFLLLLLLIWLVVRHRRQEQTWEEAIGEVSEDSHKQADIDEADSNAMVAPEVTEVASSSEQPEKTVDELVEQADMFVGYADYVQARTALEQAYHLAPENKAVAAKLLFVLFKQNKAAEFNNVLADSNIDETDSQWSDVRGWGLALMPNDARFKANPSADLEPQPDAQAESADSDNATLESQPSAYQLDTSEDEAASSIDFDVSQYQADDEITTTASNAEPEEAETDDLSAIDFDDSRSMQTDEKVSSDDLEPIHLDLDDSEEDNDFADWQKSEELPPLDDSVQPISLDMDDDDETESEVDSEAEKVAMQELELGDAQDDLDFDFSGFDEVDEAETKLDLAAAYIDMGDPDGARGILREVVSEGTDEQKQRAQVLLDSLV
ncbi:MAG: FimV/HubP family polar landmark protein [Methylophaga sp.]|nr:FimV/HubP family polar landmark protein [Methylophaga sp.]